MSEHVVQPDASDGCIARSARLLAGPDLEKEYAKVRAAMAQTPAVTSLQSFAVVCAIAIARVNVLERELEALKGVAKTRPAAEDERPGLSGHA
jgi:hypothetical protein